MAEGIEVCLITTPEDYKISSRLGVHAAALKRSGRLSLTERVVDAKNIWRWSTPCEIISADVLLLFISPEMLSSGYLESPEAQIIEEKRRERSVRLIPLLARRVEGWKSHKLYGLVSLPTDRFITGRSMENDLVEVVGGLRQVISELTN